MKHFLTLSLCFLALSLSVYGQNNYSMSFDGDDDYVEINDLEYGPTTSTNFAVSCWFKTSPYSGGMLAAQYDNGNAANSNFFISYNGENGNFHIGGDGTNSFEFAVDQPTDNWIHFTAIFKNDGVVDAFVNGNLAATGNINLNASVASIPLTFGRLLGDFPNFLGGEIDDVQIWSKTLTTLEIQQYMTCPPTGNEEGLVGYWNFDEGSGTTAFDQTDNGNNGTINGATWSTDTPEQNCQSGCTDSTACNYNPNADYDDGSCEYFTCKCLNGTLWSEELEGCVVANPTDTNLDGCTDLNDLMDILANYGDCAVAEFTCGDDIEHEGYNYSTVQIGDQCWFSENCRYLPVVSPSSEGSETEPYYYVYDYQGTDVEEAQATANYETYGVLYNWPAVMTDEICPSDWHVPSDGEVTELADFLGGESVAGYTMKSTSGWWGGGNGSNSSGFTALPGGVCGLGSFSGSGGYCYWWSSTESTSDTSWLSGLDYSLIYVYRDVDPNNRGFSARCIKD